MPLKARSKIYELKITLLDIDPPIWRRIQVSDSIKLCCLHTAFQVAMGWTDSHLHQFEKDGKNWGVPASDEFEELDLIDESQTELGEVLRVQGDIMTYRYDFGDDWEHEIALEKVQSAESALKHPICLGGERRCPPEDVGGVHGYQEFLDAILDPKHEQYEQMVRWAGGHFHDQFHLKAVNGKLSRTRWPVRHQY